MISQTSAPLRSLFAPALVALAGIAVLISLGVWQLHRLAWKEALIARIEARAKAPPGSLPPESAWAAVGTEDYEYRHVTLHGRFEGRQALVFRGSGPEAGEGPGYLVLAPLILPDGAAVIVNRGFVPSAAKDPAAHPPPPGEATVTGLMREPEPRNLFTPADQPDRNLWFTRDPGAIAAHFGLSRAAPFSIDADYSGDPKALPRGGTTVIAFPNNHLAYVLTWFGLAAALAGVFGSWAWSRLKHGAAPEALDRPANW
ncbi:MAG: surfeit locus 1 family protein [Methylobacteriaceae bacterium]|nr:surfeit locus 1 family protein [Methylobacteriaceae bacterium]